MYAITAVKNPFRDTKRSVFYVNNFIINARRVSSFFITTEGTFDR